MNAEPSIMLRTGEFLDLLEGLRRKINLFQQKNRWTPGFLKGVSEAGDDEDLFTKSEKIASATCCWWSSDSKCTIPVKASSLTQHIISLRPALLYYFLNTTNNKSSRDTSSPNPHFPPAFSRISNVWWVHVFSAVVITQFICRISLSSWSNSVVADPV